MKDSQILQLCYVLVKDNRQIGLPQALLHLMSGEKSFLGKRGIGRLLSWVYGQLKPYHTLEFWLLLHGIPVDLSNPIYIKKLKETQLRWIQNLVLVCVKEEVNHEDMGVK